MNKIRLAAVLLGTALAATGCTAGPEKVDGAAAPAGKTGPTAAPTSVPTTASPPPSVAASPSPSASRSPSAGRPSRPPTLGPDGFGALKLGMSREQAEATGMIVGYEVEDFTGNCGMSKLRGTNTTVAFTPGLGLSNIPAYGDVRTPEGIGLGSTMAAVQKAYPRWENHGVGGTGWGWTGDASDGKPAYRIDVRNGKVISVVLSARGQKCLE